MTTQYKKLASYFLDRTISVSATGSDSGYYYGSGDTELTEGFIGTDVFNAAKISNTVDFYSKQSGYRPNAIEVSQDSIFVALENLDGGIVASRPEKTIVKFSHDGTRDSSFNFPTLTGYSNQTAIRDMDVRSDGKLVAVGSISSVGSNTSTRRLAVFNADASTDTSVNSLPLVSSTDYYDSVSVQSDNKMVVSGYFTWSSTVRRLGRLNANGSIDNSFTLLNFSNHVRVNEIQPDGKILAGGRFLTVGGYNRVGIARLNSNGTVDETFEPAWNIWYGGDVNAIKVMSDGKILIGGTFNFSPDFGATRYRVLLRLNSDGSVDNTFQPDIDYILDYLQSVRNISISSNNEIIISGSASSGAVIKLDQSGNLISNYSAPGGYGSTIIAKYLPNNSIVASSTGGVIESLRANTGVIIGTDGAVSRLDDTSFAFRNAYDVAIQEDGKKIIVGAFDSVFVTELSYNNELNNRPGIVRLNKDGSIDQSFYSNINSSVTKVAIQDDGKILIAGGFSSINGTSVSNIARLNSDGSLDTSFSPDLNGTCYAIKTLSDGKILIAGSFTTVNSTSINRVARITKNGSLDTTFNPPAINNEVFTIDVQPDGKIMIGGSFAFTDNGVTVEKIARLNEDGTLDNIITDFTHFPYGTVRSIAFDKDENIFIAGDFTNFAVLGESTNYSNLIKLKKDLTLDSSFVNDLDFSSSILSIGLYDDGKIVVAGEFRSPAESVIRLNADGSIDKNFDVQASALVRSVKVTPDGKTLIVGDFTSINNEEAFSFAEIKEVVNNAPYKLAYTVPANTEVILKSIFVTNHNDFPIFNDIVILPESDQEQGVSEKHYYVWDKLIDSNDYENMESSVTLSSGDQIYVYSSTDESISYNIFGVEITP